MKDAKEKAEDLYYKFYILDSLKCEADGGTAEKTAKKCALICVDEELKMIDNLFGAYNIEDEWFDSVIARKRKELEEVKQEIKNLNKQI